MYLGYLFSLSVDRRDKKGCCSVAQPCLWYPLLFDQTRTLNTDGKTTYYTLSDNLNLKSDKIIYNEEDHKLKWLNIIIGDIKNNITGIYHGVTKRDFPLFLNEQEWRFNHRYSGSNIACSFMYFTIYFD